MSSLESDALRAQYQDMADRMAADSDMRLPALRAMFEELHTLASEPVGVSYEEGMAGSCRALWCIPVDAASDRVLLYFHGGGFVTNSADSHRKMAAHLAKAAGVRALVLDYRRAPEHPCPAQLEDAVSTYRWLLEQGYAARHIASVGDSAGGNLATGAVLALRNNGIELPAAIVAISPAYDVDGRSRNVDSDARNDAILTKVKSLGLVSLYLGERGSATDPLVNPLYADLTGLPPIYLSCGTHETLRDDAVRFAALAEKAGVSATLDVNRGMQHVHTYMAGRAPEADATIAAIGGWLRPRLGLT
ncbi:alpha/beta hydrolase [Nocardia jiangxiensis]|uniref:Alpha/beta hydrolase n=1 Tax=Nocardia jiangxiensis TaxID=282685 RepID=A0ABW6SDZ1_9NOCA|nr:alpha/beta hydrolase [Nocardia jiangxiensis]